MHSYVHTCLPLTHARASHVYAQVLLQLCEPFLEPSAARTGKGHDGFTRLDARWFDRELARRAPSPKLQAALRSHTLQHLHPPPKDLALQRAAPLPPSAHEQLLIVLDEVAPPVKGTRRVLVLPRAQDLADLVLAADLLHEDGALEHTLDAVDAARERDDGLHQAAEHVLEVALDGLARAIDAHRLAEVDLLFLIIVSPSSTSSP